MIPSLVAFVPPSVNDQMASNSSEPLDLAPPEVKKYQRQKLLASIVSIVIGVACLALYAFLLDPWLDAAMRDWLGENNWLRLLVVAVLLAGTLQALTLPLELWSGYVLEHRYGLSNQTLSGWLWKQIKSGLLGGILGLGLLFGFYALMWFTGDWWWVWTAIGWLAVTLVLGQLLPVVILPLFYKVTRLDDVSLLERLRGLAAGTGLNVEGIYRLHLSAETKKANAALAGLGRTRRVLLGDTLLDEFTPEEIEVVFAHEVGHHVHRHLFKMVVYNVFLAAVGLWLVDQVLRASAAALGYAAMGSLPDYQNPAALPLVLLVLSLFGLILSPLQNAVSRFFERQCDRYALRRTRLVDAYRSAFTKLARMNKADPDPHPVVVWFFDDHPPIRQRLALADAVAPPEPNAAR
jgi:STE24 endopeptidase